MKTFRSGNRRNPELRRLASDIEQAANQAEPFQVLKVWHAEPERVVPGMMVHADGTDWDPGSGEALYQRDEANSSWIQVGGAAAQAWAIKTDAAVSGSDYSAKEYAQGTQASTGGSSKNWAQQSGAITGAGANDRSSKSWAQADLTGATLGGSAKDWAQSASLPDGTNKSAKSYATDAETARDAALAATKIYADTTAGLAAVASGEYFYVVSAEDDETLILYKDNAGVAEDTGKRMPDADAVKQPKWSGHKNAWLDPFLKVIPLAGNSTYQGKNRWYTGGSATLTYNSLVANPKFDGYAVQRTADAGTTSPLVGPFFNLSDFGISGATTGDTITCYALFTGDGGVINWPGRFDDGAGSFVGGQVNPASSTGGTTVTPNGDYLWLRHEQTVPATAQRFATWFYTNTAAKTIKLVGVWAFKGAASVGPQWPVDIDNTILQTRVTDAETDIATLQTQVASELVVPPYFYALQSQEANAYWDAFVPDDYQGYMFRMQPDTGSLGTIQNERWTWTPTGALTTGYVWVRCHDKKLGTEAVTAVQMQTRAAASSYGNGLTKKVICIGDSLLNSTGITTTLLSLATADVMALTLLGTRGSGTNKHEGRGGWKWEFYATNYSDGTYGANPFWNAGAIDFANYLSANSIATPDWVIIQLGTNDCFSQSSDSAVVTLADTVFTSYADPLITSIKAAGASIKVALALPPPPSYDQDAFGNDYGTAQWRGRYKRNITVWNRELIERYSGQEASRIYIVPSNLALDTIHNMATTSVAVNSRNSTTVDRQSNGVHPATSGYQQIADAWWAFLKWHYSA